MQCTQLNSHSPCLFIIAIVIYLLNCNLCLLHFPCTYYPFIGVSNQHRQKNMWMPPTWSAAPRQMMTNNSYPRHLHHHHPNPNQQLIMHSQHNNNTLPPMFIPSETFQGARAGYVFRSSTQGTGYYLDVQFVQTTLDKKKTTQKTQK